MNPNQPGRVRDLDASDVAADALNMWQQQIDRLVAELDNFGPRDALSVFTEWLGDQPTVEKGEARIEGFEDFYVKPEARDQETIYITINEG